MKLQLALDMLNSNDAIQVASTAGPWIDIIEIGTPLIKHEGIQILKTLRTQFPDKQLLVDLKSMDVGQYEADFCFQHGADIVTVLGVSDDDTIKGTITSAKTHQKQVMVDLINVEDKVERARQCLAWGADWVGIHSGIDQQNRGESPMKDLQALVNRGVKSVSVAGGIKQETIAQVAALNPDIVVVGGAITQAPNPAMAAQTLKETMMQVAQQTQQEHMSVADYIGHSFLEKVEGVLTNADVDHFHQLIEGIEQTKRIFFVGAGRSGLVCRFFAMRLLHLGKQVFIVGDTNTPPITGDDLLIAISSSGMTESVVLMAEKAKQQGATVANIGTIQAKQSKLDILSDLTIRFDRRIDQKQRQAIEQNKQPNNRLNITPLGTLFEITALVYLESAIGYFLQKGNLAESELSVRHANLE